MATPNSLMVPRRGDLSGGPFVSRRSSLLFDVYPAGQQQAVVPAQPFRGSVSLPASTAYLERAAAVDAFNFNGDGTTSTFTASFWIKFNSFTSGDCILGKASKVIGSETHSSVVWVLGLGGTGKQLNLRVSTPSAVQQATWSLSGLSVGVWYFFVVTYDGAAGAAKALFYMNASLQSTPNSTAMPQHLESNSVPFFIGRPTSTTGGDNNTPGNFELQSPLFLAATVDASTVTSLYGSGAGKETSQYSSALGSFGSSRIAQYELNENSGATRLDSNINALHLTDNNTVATKLRVVTVIENSPNNLVFRGGVGPYDAPVYSRNSEPWFFRDKFGVGKHAITFDVLSSLYCPTTILQGQTTGHFFWAGVYDTVADSEFFEMNAGDDSTLSGEPNGNNHAMFMGYLGTGGGKLTGVLNAPVIRPDGSDMDVPFGGLIHNCATPTPNYGVNASNNYMTAGTPLVIERSCLSATVTNYRIAVNGVAQTIIVDGLANIPWFDAFICRMITLGWTNSSLGGFTMARACAFKLLSNSECAQVNRIMKATVGLT